MQLSTIRKNLAEKPFAFLQNTPIEVDVYFNRFVIKLGKGETLEIKAKSPFSNSRLIIADFDTAVETAQEMIKLVPSTWYLGQPNILVNVKETLADGFTLIEGKILYELFLSVNHKCKPIIFYQDEWVMGG